jgi:hypothetical protein
MKPEEKANNLCMRFLIQTTTDIPYGINKTIAKECALIAVDEILEALKIELTKDVITIDVANFAADKIIYWEEVKQEIEKL